jgi:hypothetical protein
MPNVFCGFSFLTAINEWSSFYLDALQNPQIYYSFFPSFSVNFLADWGSEQ